MFAKNMEFLDLVLETTIWAKKSIKLGATTILINDEVTELVQYLKDMVKTSCPLNTTQLRLKVAEITQARMTPFTNGVPRRFWIKGFKQRHPQLVLRMREALNMNRVKDLSPTSVFHFYYNLEQLYLKHQYEPYQI